MANTQYGKNIKTDSNIFRQAKQLLREKPVLEMNEEELEVVKIATMPLLQLRHFSDLPIDDGLEELSKIVEEDVGRSEPSSKRKPTTVSEGRGVE